MYLCEEGATDSDGDRICDAAELQYGTDPSKSDSDGDGEYDDQEFFGSGSPFTPDGTVIELVQYNVQSGTSLSPLIHAALHGVYRLLITDY
ncbi:thrombospondin type 3 repeat-containing protein [bacterium]|nr:thrombospondin type 3 repeat-containing protein [bacterium]